jgi:hypothetical protein
LTATSNGDSRRWTIERDPRFSEDRDRLVARHSRLQGVFSAIEDQFKAIPTYRAIELGRDRWLYVTQAALNAPPVVLFYEIDVAEHVVMLIGADLNE